MNAARMGWRIARRELRGGLKGFRVFLACLALGVAAIAAVGIVRSGIQAGLEQEGASLLGGDAEIELTYRFASDEERAWLEEVSEEVSEIADFRSMLVVERDDVTERGLTQVKSVDDAYPLYGEVDLGEAVLTLADALKGDGTHPGIVVDPLLIDRLGLEIGETVRLGVQDFVLMAPLNRAPDEAGGGFSMGPRSIVATEALAASGLLSSGTLFETEYRMRLPEDQNLDALRAEAGRSLDAAGIQWRDRRNGAPGVARFVERLSAFLVLVGLTGIAVGGVGIAAAVRAYLNEKTTVIATLRSLGADGLTIFLTYIYQIGVLTVLGISIGLVLGAAIPLALAPMISAQLPVPADFALRVGPLAEAALYGVLSAALFTLWPLAKTENVRAAALFRDLDPGTYTLPHPRWITATVLILGALVGSAAVFSGLVSLTVWVALGVLGAFAVLLLAAFLIRRFARWAARAPLLRRHFTLRAALAAVGGPGGDASSVVLSLGLGLSVLAAVGQIQWNLANAIEQDLPDVAPSYFVVDIQDDQLASLADQFDANPAISRVDTAPMLRGVITQINGRPAREVAGPHWVLRGDRGITYSDRPGATTIVTDGAWWPADYDGDPQISFAAEEAEEMGLKLGDRLTVNVLGRDITAGITSFREVDFSNAGIGFILSMNPAALRGAPHTHIATVYATPEAEPQILRDIGANYPNITAIRVSDAIARVADVLASIAAAITYGALATLATGAVVLIGTAAASERARTYEGAILKTLGASRATILANFALRSAILGLTAGVIALFAGGLGAWAVTTFVMEASFRFEPLSALMIIAGGTSATLLTGLIFAWRPLSARPAQVLRTRE